MVTWIKLRVNEKKRIWYNMDMIESDLHLEKAIQINPDQFVGDEDDTAQAWLKQQAELKTGSDEAQPMAS